MDKINKWWILELVFNLLAFFSAFLSLFSRGLCDDTFPQFVYLHSNYSSDIFLIKSNFFFICFALFMILSIVVSHYRYRHYGCRYKKCLYRKDSSKQ